MNGTPDMKLTYRGIGYDYEPPSIDMMESEFGGKYRGNAWTVRYPRHVPVPQPVATLKYRGVPYQTGQTLGSRTPVTASVPAAAIAVSMENPHEEMLAEVAKAHRESICRSLERRLEAAKARGDRHLVQMLEKESQQLTCSIG
jgi:hypothetical protein